MNKYLASPDQWLVDLPRHTLRIHTTLEAFLLSLPSLEKLKAGHSRQEKHQGDDETPESGAKDRIRHLTPARRRWICTETTVHVRRRVRAEAEG